MLRTELKVVGGKQDKKIIALPQKKFIVGREQDCHLRPNSESVSRHHCVFTIDDYSVRLRDLGSTNGTFVNDNRIHGQVELHSNDRILIGKLGFVVLIHDTAEDDANQAADAPPAELLETNGAISAETMLNLPVSQLDDASAEKSNVVSGETEIISNTAELLNQETQTEASPSFEPHPIEQQLSIVEQPESQQPQPDSQPQPVAVSAPAVPQQPQVPQQPVPQQPMMQPMMQPPMPMQQPVYQQPTIPQQGVPPEMLQQQLMQQMLQQQMLQQQQMQQPMAPIQQPMPQASQPVPQTPVAEEPATAKAVPAPIPINLPPPESTGIQDEPASSDDESKGESKEKVPNPAADIIKQYMNRRSSSSE